MFNIRHEMSAESDNPAHQDSSFRSLTMDLAKLYPRLDSRPKGRKPRASAPFLLPHPHRPNVQGRDRIAFWTSPAARYHREQIQMSATAADRTALDSLLENSLSKGTLSTYGSGLAQWQSWCDSRNIPENDRLPASSNNLSLFLASLSRTSVSKIGNAMSALHHWHDINGQVWHGDHPFVQKIRHAAVASVPPPILRPTRPPVLPQHLVALRNSLNFNDTFDSAVFAVATCAFWGVCHLGEITVPSVAAFAPEQHVTHACGAVFSSHGYQHVRSVKFHVPWTKTEKFRGADISLTAISGPSCPVLALEHHLLSNAGLPPSAHFFAYKTPAGHLPMVKAAFMDRCTEIFTAAGLPPIQGHSFRIGGATEHLRRGLSVDLLKIQGRWKSDAFQRYMRKTDEILSVNIADRDVQHRLHMDLSIQHDSLIS